LLDCELPEQKAIIGSERLWPNVGAVV